MLQDRTDFPSNANSPIDRIAALDGQFGAVVTRLPEMCHLALTGLQRMSLVGLRFPNTMRAIGTVDGSGTRPEGDNLRYAIIVAQGLAWSPETVQRQVLQNHAAIELLGVCIDRAKLSDDPGAIALAAWAAAETAGLYVPELFARLETYLSGKSAVQTVPCAWALTAAIAACHLGSTTNLQRLASRLLLHAQSPSGLFGHTIPASGFARAHIGCFADQVYPIQALARLGFADNDPIALQAANACAARIVTLQGPAGQFWWHYDTRDGSVVEGYPVYSVHQHAMAPMALLDLFEAGGTDYRDAVVKGLQWIDQRPETTEPMISPEDAMIWRKVGRQEPPKLVRSLSAVTTFLRAGWHLPGLDTAFPPAKVDRECRPYEFGWMLYAWNSRGVVQTLRQTTR